MSILPGRTARRSKTLWMLGTRPPLDRHRAPEARERGVGRPESAREERQRGAPERSAREAPERSAREERQRGAPEKSAREKRQRKAPESANPRADATRKERPRADATRKERERAPDIMTSPNRNNFEGGAPIGKDLTFPNRNNF